MVQRNGFGRWFGWRLGREDAGDFSGWWRLCIFGIVVENKVLFKYEEVLEDSDHLRGDPGCYGCNVSGQAASC